MYVISYAHSPLNMISGKEILVYSCPDLSILPRTKHKMSSIWDWRSGTLPRCPTFIAITHANYSSS